MDNTPMSDDFVEEIVSRLAAAIEMPKESLISELQDDSQLLFVSISAEGISETDLHDKRKHITEIMQSLMPKRTNDYSWVVGFKRDGEIIDSCFGGNLAAASWGD